MTKFIKLHNRNFEFILNIDNISHFCKYYNDDGTTIYLKQSKIYQDENNYMSLRSEIYSIKSDETPEEIMKLIERG